MAKAAVTYASEIQDLGSVHTSEIHCVLRSKLRVREMLSTTRAPIDPKRRRVDVYQREYIGTDIAHLEHGIGR